MTSQCGKFFAKLFTTKYDCTRILPINNTNEAHEGLSLLLQHDHVGLSCLIKVVLTIVYKIDTKINI